MERGLFEACADMYSNVRLKGEAQATLELREDLTPAEQRTRQQLIVDCEMKMRGTFNRGVGLAAKVTGLQDKEVPEDAPDGAIFARMQPDQASSTVRALRNVVKWEYQRRAIAAFTISGRWPLEGGWWRYTWSTWALVAVMVSVAAACVVLCAAPPLHPAVERWQAVAAALAVLAPSVCAAVVAVGQDSRQRRQDASNAIKQLKESAQAAEQLVEQLRQLGMLHFFQLVYSLQSTMVWTANQADEALQFGTLTP